MFQFSLCACQQELILGFFCFIHFPFFYPPPPQPAPHLAPPASISAAPAAPIATRLARVGWEEFNNQNIFLVLCLWSYNFQFHSTQPAPPLVQPVSILKAPAAAPAMPIALVRGEGLWYMHMIWRVYVQNYMIWSVHVCI